MILGSFKKIREQEKHFRLTVKYAVTGSASHITDELGNKCTYNES
jgi:hypothetical protein